MKVDFTVPEQRAAEVKLGQEVRIGNTEGDLPFKGHVIGKDPRVDPKTRLVAVQALVEDNKDGTMAIRVAQWLTMPHKIQQKEIPGIGHIVTAKGARDAAAWGTRADWCDYFAEHNGKTYGVAIFNHPENLRHPTWWMARDYGLFGANPFGQKDFEPAANHPAGKGDYTIPAGGSLTLRYRFYFHFGDEKAAGIAERYNEYTAGK